MKAFAILALMIFSSIQLAAQTSSTETSDLSPAGKSAYTLLQQAKIFRIGPVGYGGEESPEEIVFLRT